VVKRLAILGISAIALLVVAALLLSNHSRLAVLTPATLSPKAPPQPEDCSAIQRAVAQYFPSTGSRRDKPAKILTPLSGDEIAIYKAVIEGWVAGDHPSLNVSLTTFPLDLEFSECRCLQGIQVESLLSAAR
jgi:hypothetical protein